MARPTIAILLSHSAAGGAQEIMADIGHGLRTRGFAVRLVALYPAAGTIQPTAFDWEYIVPTKPRSPLAAARFLRAAVAWFRRERPDYVLAALPAANVIAAFAAWAARRGTRVVTTHHSPADTHNRAIDALDTRAGALPSVAAIVSVSAAVERSLDGKPARYRARRRVIRNALPPRIEQAVEAIAATRGAPDRDARRAMAIGRLHPQKNYPVLIRAAARMPDVAVEIVGAGADKAELQAQAAALGVGERVTFIGFHPRAEALRLLGQASLFVQMSRYEGHSLALIEAAKLGLPLVVSDVPVQIEGITGADGTRHGVVVPVDDDAALAAAITALLDDPARYAAAAAAARALGAQSRFDAMVDAYAALLTEAA